MVKDENYHEDEKIRLAHSRHAGIVLKDKQILLMQRIYEGFEYWVIPGGHIQINEEPKDAVIREILEETSLKITNPTLVFEFKDYKKNNFDSYYLCTYKSGEPKLNGEEIVRNNPENFYKPQFVDLEKIEELNILPKFAKEWIVENLL